jgi:hypothetical protein
MTEHNPLLLLEKMVLSEIDWTFVSRLNLPYNNSYYLVCFAEVLCKFINENKEFNSVEEAVDNINNLARELYDNVNISSVFYPYFTDSRGIYTS